MVDDPKDPLVTGDDVDSAKENPEPVAAPTPTDEAAAEEGLPANPTETDGAQNG